MDNNVIDNMPKEEILELLSPYLNAGKSGTSYYEMIRTYKAKIKMSDDPKYTHGRIHVFINMVDITGIDKWTDIGSVGPKIYGEVVSKYRDMIINKIL